MNFKFTDRTSSFIFGEENCEPFRVFLYNRPPGALDRLILYHIPSGRFGDKVLSAKKPTGPKPLAKAVQKQVQALLQDGRIMEGLYTQTLHWEKGWLTGLHSQVFQLSLLILQLATSIQKGAALLQFLGTHQIWTVILACGNRQTQGKRLAFCFMSSLWLGRTLWMKMIFLPTTAMHSLNAIKKTQHAQHQITVKQVVVTDNVLDFDQFEFDDTLLSQNKHPHAIDIQEQSSLSPLPLGDTHAVMMCLTWILIYMSFSCSC